MENNKIKKIIDEAKKVNIEEIKTQNKDLLQVLKSIYTFLQNVELEYSELIECLMNSHIRFCDYYDSESIHGENITEYFDMSYNEKDKEKMLQVFSLYVFF